jgi:YlmC/YmxH family sporulation protein
MRICQLRQKEVINICTGMRIGFIADVEIDLEKGKIIAIIVPGPCKLWGIIGRDHEYVISFACITNVGPDIVLVEIDEKECLKKIL